MKAVFLMPAKWLPAQTNIPTIFGHNWSFKSNNNSNSKIAYALVITVKA